MADSACRRAGVALDRSDAHAAKKAKAVPSVAVVRPRRTELLSADQPPPSTRSRSYWARLRLRS